MVGNQTKPRCHSCKSLLIKGTVVSGIALIRCETCGTINSLSVRDDKLVKLEKDLRSKNIGRSLVNK